MTISGVSMGSSVYESPLDGAGKQLEKYFIWLQMHMNVFKKIKMFYLSNDILAGYKFMLTLHS